MGFLTIYCCFLFWLSEFLVKDLYSQLFDFFIYFLFDLFLKFKKISKIKAFLIKNFILKNDLSFVQNSYFEFHLFIDLIMNKKTHQNQKSLKIYTKINNLNFTSVSKMKIIKSKYFSFLIKRR